jgi:hypothetical protein
MEKLVEQISHHGDGYAPTGKRMIMNPYLKRAKAPPDQVINGPVDNVQAPVNFLETSLAIEIDSAPTSKAFNTPIAMPCAILMENKSLSAGDLPPSKRLPSSSVTFQSGEILSVSELNAGSTNYKDKSIRVTGVVLHRHIYQEDGSVCFVLGDPLLRTPIRSPTFTTPCKERTKPLHQSGLSHAKTSLSTGKNSLLLGARSTRRLVHTPKASLKTNKLSGQRRPRSIMTPVDNLVSTLLNQRVVLVIADPIHVHVRECGLGDSIMVIGEVHVVDDDAPAQQVLGLWREKRNAQQVDAGEVLTYIRPRILRNVNGTDARLQFEALKLRRMHLLSI